MGINSLNNANKLDLVKLVANKSGGSTKATRTPLHMSKNGSIFNAPGAKGKETQQAGGGRPSASEGKAMASNLKGMTKDTQAQGKEAQQFGKESANLHKQMDKDTKKFEKTFAQEQQNFHKTQADIKKNTADMKSNQMETDNLTKELESLTAGDNTGVGSSSAFSLQLGGAQSSGKSSGSSGNQNSDRINDLLGRIESKQTGAAGYMNTGKKLQMTSDRSVRMMNTSSNQQVKMNKANQKGLDADNKATQKIIEVANTVDQVSSMVSTTGTVLGTVGKAMIGYPPTAAAGAALINVGTVMETVGQYGSCAANLTKTVAYAAEGNIAGALTSAGSAVLSGASAVKNTKSMSATFKATNAQAEAVKQAGAEAKQNIENATTKALEKQAKKKGKAAIAEASKNAAETGAQSIAEASGSGTFDKLSKAGQGLQTAGAQAGKLMPQNQAQGQTTAYGKATKPYNPQNQQAALKIMAQGNQYRANSQYQINPNQRRYAA